jgi:transposase-like protein
MPSAGLNSIKAYWIRGAHPTESAPTLLGAIQRLIQFWESRRSLAVHEMGNLKVTLQIGNREVTADFVDPALLDLLRQDPNLLVQEVIQLLGVGPEMGATLLEHARATVEVNTLRVPYHPTAWTSEAPPEVVLPAAAPWMIAETMAQIDRQQKRGVRRSRSKEARLALDLLVKKGRESGKTASQIARESGLPASTVRDTVTRQVRVETGAPRPTRLTPTVVKEALTKTAGNAAAAARQKGVPERTLRDARARAARIEAAKTAPPPSVRDPATKATLLAAVQAGEKPSVAARRLGIAPRTARDWAHDARLKK